MKINSESLADQVYSWVKSEILKGNIKGGEKISEESLAAKLGVSRTPIREALKRLSEYGIVAISPRSHAHVIKLTETDAEEIANFRICLEIFAIDNIKEDILLSKLQNLRTLAIKVSEANGKGNRDKSFELDSKFHIELVNCACCPPLTDAYSRLNARIQLLRLNQDLYGEDLGFFLTQHNDLLVLLEEGKKEDVKTLLKYHILHHK
ncbi:MAG: GntR family transcriptional regulator [Sphaerochaetaceae bacterium]|nr:GntR family transcriptional regulator [Sphaerochaetaceae bacterium]